MTHTLVLGVGNILLQDEGVGVRVVEALHAQRTWPDTVLLLDGGTMGLDLIGYLEGVDTMLIIDAVEARQPPGTIVRLVGSEIPAFLGNKISPHQVGISDILSVALLRDLMPREVVLIGIQPAVVATGLELSPTLTARMPAIIDAVLEQLRAWNAIS